MRLLIITQKIDINDSILGFFHSWVQEFAKHTEKLTVICLQKGEYDLPDNVSVYSLGKENSNFQFPISNSSIFKRINYIYRFYGLIWQKRKEYDTIFVHMNPEYAVLAGWLWKLWHKKVALWYTHKQVDLKLRLAEKIVDVIFTASKESFRLPSNKLKITGHGIDLEKFQPSKSKNSNSGVKFKILSVGRISPSKDYETLIKALKILKMQGFLFRTKIVGGPVYDSDKVYYERLKNLVKNENLESEIEFIGPIPNNKIVDYYNDADIFVHMSQTGSLDKVVLEAMACGLIIISNNDAVVRDVLIEYKEYLSYPKHDSNALVERIKNLVVLDRRQFLDIKNDLHRLVSTNHDLKRLIKIS